jgi:lipopolysaccharide biosynthesis protein
VTDTAAVYAIPLGLQPQDHILHALKALRPMVDRLIVVVSGEDTLKQATEVLADCGVDRFLAVDKGLKTATAGYKAGLAAIFAEGPTPERVIVTGSHVIGPFLPLDPRAFDLPAAGAAMFSAYWHNAQLDPRTKGMTKLVQLPYFDFAVFSRPLLDSAEFRGFWNAYTPAADFWADFLATSLRFAEMMAATGQTVLYPVGTDVLQTFEPRVIEVDKVLKLRLPCFPLGVFSLDPLLYDIYSIDLRPAIEELRIASPELYEATMTFVTRNIKPRDYAMMADQYAILPEVALSPGKERWSFGKVAIFIHAFYVDMMPMFWSLLRRMPCAHDLYISTSTAEHKAQIEAFLKDKGLARGRYTVVVVEHNRGRDMSSLFITFRDVVMSGRYKVALRLHSKATPQVSRQVAEGFKRHLFDNLMATPGYISNVLDRFEAEPDLGMVMPPVVHVGFGTLGHSWFNNRGAMESLIRDMGLSVRLDDNTPVAPYGTMYWFRTDALLEMFRWRWRWEDYNPEPHHIDGGLAHVQERLICYCALDRGYRILMAMTPALAERYYAKLEFKLQLLASRLASGNVILQRMQLDVLQNTMRSRVFAGLQNSYGAILRRFPASRGALRPVAKLVSRLLMSKPG